MADPITATMMIGTLAGAGISAFGSIQSGQASKAMYNYQAGVASALGGAEMQAANVTEYAGGRAAESEGLKYGGQIARGAVGYGAGNVAGRSIGDVRASQTALGVQSQREAFAKYGETAFQQRFTGAEKFAAAGLYGMAGPQAEFAGEVTAAGDVATGIGRAAGGYIEAARYAPSVVGDSQPVATKWYGSNQPVQTYSEYYG